MFDPSLSLRLARAAAIGVTAGSVVSLGLVRGYSPAPNLALFAAAPPSPAPKVSIAQRLQAPNAALLFSGPETQALNGAGNVTTTSVHLLGLVTTQDRQAALISIGDDKPFWLNVGEQQDGVSLITTSATQAQFALSSGQILDLDLFPKPVATGDSAAPKPSHGLR